MANQPCHRYSRRGASDFLKTLGYQVAPATLAKYATVGGGPIYEKFGNKPYYPENALLAWVASKTSAPRRHTSEQQAA
jgi:hypothetical protein